MERTIDKAKTFHEKCVLPELWGKWFMHSSGSEETLWCYADQVLGNIIIFILRPSGGFCQEVGGLLYISKQSIIDTTFNP
jgi:hypothetical protein